MNIGAGKILLQQSQPSVLPVAFLRAEKRRWKAAAGRR